MKKLFFAAAILATSVSFGQNTFPITGNVGIGTTIPVSKLEILEATDSKPAGVLAPTKSVLKLSRAGTPNYSYPENAEFRIGHGGPNVYGSKLDLYINGSANTNTIPDQHVMTWNYDGNVGIGTTTPSAKLHVNNGNNSYGAILANSSELPFSLYTKTISTNVANAESFRIGLKYDSNENNGFISFYRGESSNGGFLGFSTNGLERIRISASGNVGIGSLNPDEKLTVKGKIHSEEVRVDLLVPADYVFEKYYTGASALKVDYVMPSLAEVEKYTKANNHLPNVPSAQEIKDKGLQLGEMSNLLLQKVEELTLYIIEQNKKIEALEAKVNGK
jgi:hypothetical protein